MLPASSLTVYGEENIVDDADAANTARTRSNVNHEITLLQSEISILTTLYQALALNIKKGKFRGYNFEQNSYKISLKFRLFNNTNNRSKKYLTKRAPAK